MPGLTAVDLEERSFYELLRDRFHIAPVSGIQTVEPTVTNDDESELLGVPLHSPAFLFERITRAASGDVVEYVRSIYRGDRYRLVSELGRNGAGDAGTSLDPTDYQAVVRPVGGIGLDKWAVDMPRSHP